MDVRLGKKKVSITWNFLVLPPASPSLFLHSSFLPSFPSLKMRYSSSLFKNIGGFLDMQ